MILYSYTRMFAGLLSEILLFNNILLFKTRMDEGVIIQCEGQQDQSFEFKQLRGMKKVESCKNL